MQCEGEPFRANYACHDQGRYCCDGEDKHDAPEDLMSDSCGSNPESSRAAPMCRISLKVASGERKAACLRVPPTRWCTIVCFTGVSASDSSTV